jgi:integrase
MHGCRAFIDDEVKLIAKSFGGRYATRNRALFVSGVRTGLRISELLSLTVGDVQQHRRMVEAVSVHANELTGTIGTHSMRKSFASRMYDRLGKDLVKVQAVMGHANINSTVRYLNFRQEDVVNAILAA